MNKAHTTVRLDLIRNFGKRPVLVVETKHLMLGKMFSKPHDKDICCRVGWCTNEDTGFWSSAKYLKYGFDNSSVTTTSVWLKIDKPLLTTLFFLYQEGH